MIDTSKEVFSKNLRLYMKKNLKTQADICNALNISKATFSTWVNGTKFPRMDKVQLLADYFNIMKSDLTEEQKEFGSRPRGIRIPVLGCVVAGIPLEAVEEILDYEEIDEQLANTGEFFGLQIRGESMEPIMSQGDVVIVRKQEDVNSGDTAIILVNGDEATVKKIIKKENGIMLVPNNQAFEPMFFDEYDILTLPVKIIGRVMELRKKF